MEIYYYRGFWFGLLLAVPTVLVSLIQFDIIEYSNKASDTAGYIIIGVLGFLTILATFASTRLYFDNRKQACIQIRNHFYGGREVVYPYADILNIALVLSRNSGQPTAEYRVVFTRATMIFGRSATKTIELRKFGNEQSGYIEAVKFAKEVCQHSALSYLDDSKNEKLF
jgi:hypothetical protein